METKAFNQFRKDLWDDYDFVLNTFDDRYNPVVGISSLIYLVCNY